jgi:hypothetical protein
MKKATAQPVAIGVTMQTNIASSVIWLNRRSQPRIAGTQWIPNK